MASLPATNEASVEQCILRLNRGDQGARDELVNAALDRLNRLTRKLLRGFPQVRRWEESSDILQNAMLRLCRAIESVELTDARHFFRLAARHIRHELIDLARRYAGPQGLGANHATQPGARPSEQTESRPLEPAESTYDPRRLAEWAELHARIDRLGEEQREVFDLLWYHELTQEQAAEIVGVDVRTIKRRWRDARLALHRVWEGS